VLIKVLDERSKSKVDKDIALVHARLGDGLCAKYDPPCRGTRNGDPDCWNDEEDGWFDRSILRHYAYSKNWYEPVISQLHKLEVKRIFVVVDKFHWTRTPDPRQGDYSVDEGYLDKMVNFFREHGFEADVHVPHLPDSDFMYLCSATIFVRGGGGFSSLIATVVENRGGTLLVPSKA